MSSNLMSSPNSSSNNNNVVNSVTIEAKSLEQALAKAAGTLGVAQSDMGYEVIKEDANKGIFSFFKNPIVEIRAWVKEGAARTNNNRASAPRGRESGNQRRPTTSHRDRPARQRRDDAQTERDSDEESAVKAEPLSPEKTAALIAELSDFCAGICSGIAGETVNVTATNDDGRLVLNIDNEYIAQQITKNTKLAEAMEHILRKKPRHLRQELPFRIFIDVSGLRRKREEDLIQMAHDLSTKVHENRRPIVLNYKSSYDRKIIHMALDKDDRVYTKSIGSGPNRKLMILPSRDGGEAASDEAPIEME